MTTITRVRGDDWAIPGVIADSDTPVDLTGATVTSQLRRHTEAATATATFTATVTDAVAGAVTLTLADTVTAAIDPGVYTYDVQVVDGSITTTYGAGSLLDVRGDATR